jgi:hypothetical protein
MLGDVCLIHIQLCTDGSCRNFTVAEYLHNGNARGMGQRLKDVGFKLA